MGSPILEIAGLTIGLPRGSDRAHAVQGVSLAVAANEIVCLVGESGSGKSVIAHATMGLLPRALAVTGGSIRLAGEELVGASERRLEALRCTRMAMIFQEPMTALNPVMRCGEQIDEVLRRHTTLDATARRAKVLEGLADVRLPDPARMASSYPHQLSGGQRQRIMIAMALVLDPKLLIADEPTTALDVTTQAQILALVRDLMREHGTGVLFITHDFGVVAEIADRVAVLKQGELVEVGTSDEVLRAPKHDYTKMLIAAVPSMTPRHRSVVTTAPLVEARGLGKTYVQGGWLSGKREVRAADDVALEIRRGETLGIVGESGSGKSTVARCIARLVDPTSGSVKIDGLEVAKLPRRRLREMRRKVQIVFQDPYRSLNPRRTVGASIVEGPMNFGVSLADAMKRARSLMELVRLDPASLDRYPHEFSGGQRQRLCIARALAMEPALLVADEPVSALDVSVQAQVLALLDEIRERLHLTMLFITHDLRVAAQVCDRIAVMREGRVVEEGPIAEVYAHPKHEYTQQLLAAAPGAGVSEPADLARSGSSHEDRAMSEASVRVAVVQAGSVPFDTDACVEKVVKLTADAAAKGAKLVLFPEAFVAGYPKGLSYGLVVGARDAAGREEFRLYLDSAIEVPGPHTRRMGEAAAAGGCFLVVGVIERELGTCYCTVLFFGPDGALLGKHRKLMPTALERMIWGFGDGSTLTAVDSPWGRIGSVICWENYMPMLRMAMYAKNVALYCAPTADDRDTWLPSMRHVALEGRCFVLTACQYLRKRDFPATVRVSLGDSPDAVLMRGGSAIVSPLGKVLAGPSFDGETILTADLDLAEIGRGKFDFDVAGHYARPDVFTLTVNEAPMKAVVARDP